METIIYGSGLILGSIFLSNLGLLLVRRRVPIHVVEPAHEVGGYLFAAIATLYAVLLGLIVVDAMTKFQDASHVAAEESNSVAHIYFLADQLPLEPRQKIQKLCKQYVQQVVDNEWTSMNNHCYCPLARVSALSLIKTVYSFKPSNDAENTVYGAALQETSDFWSARRSRIITATHTIPAIEWFTVLAGGIATVAFTYFFGTERLRVQIAMTSMVAFLISLNIFLLWMFSEPFDGIFRVSPESFQGDLKIFDGDLSNSLPGASDGTG